MVKYCFKQSLTIFGVLFRKLIAIRIRAKVFGWLRKTAEKRGLPYQSLVTRIQTQTLASEKQTTCTCQSRRTFLLVRLIHQTGEREQQRSTARYWTAGKPTGMVTLYEG